MQYVRSFFFDDGGATAVEYALLASLIALVIVKAISLTGTKESAVFGEFGNAPK
jgi:Flp pilus assembly pilin Flp